MRARAAISATCRSGAGFVLALVVESAAWGQSPTSTLPPLTTGATIAASSDAALSVKTSDRPACNLCSVAFDVDLDEDGQLDHVVLAWDRRLRLYSVDVSTKAGRSYSPFNGGYDGGDQEVSLSLRTGTGDLRCREWSEGHNCGFITTAHGTPTKVLYLTDSKRGDFVIYMVVRTNPTPRGSPGPRRDEYFVVMPALEGAHTMTQPQLPAGLK